MPWTATNDPEGIAATVNRLCALAPSLIVLEATGGYETSLVAALAAAATSFAAAPVKRRLKTDQRASVRQRIRLGVKTSLASCSEDRWSRDSSNIVALS